MKDYVMINGTDIIPAIEKEILKLFPQAIIEKVYNILIDIMTMTGESLIYADINFINNGGKSSIKSIEFSFEQLGIILLSDSWEIKRLE